MGRTRRKTDFSADLFRETLKLMEFTHKEVAQLAQISQDTVSRVAGGTFVVSQHLEHVIADMVCRTSETSGEIVFRNPRLTLHVEGDEVSVCGGPIMGAQCCVIRRAT